MQHQTYLILGEWQPEKVYYQSVVKLVCGNRDFPFQSYLKCQAKQVGYEILEGFYFVMQLQTYLSLGEWQPEKVYYQPEVKLVCGNWDFPF